MKNLNRRKIRQMILREMASLKEQAGDGDAIFPHVRALQDMCEKNGIQCRRPEPGMLIITLAGQEIECMG